MPAHLYRLVIGGDYDSQFWNRHQIIGITPMQIVVAARYESQFVRSDYTNERGTKTSDWRPSLITTTRKAFRLSRADYEATGRCSPPKAESCQAPFESYARYLRWWSSEESSQGTPHYLKALGLTVEATRMEIDHAFRVASLEAHPDRGGSKEAQQLVAEYYELALAWSI